MKNAFLLIILLGIGNWVNGDDAIPVPESKPPKKPISSIWLEGEDFSASDAAGMSAGGKTGVSTGTKYYGGKIYELNQLTSDKKAPADGYWVKYDFDVKEEGVYLFSIASSLPSIYASTYWYSIDHGPWQHVTAAAGSKTGWGPWQIVKWSNAGFVSFKQGKHEIKIKVDETKREDNRYIFYLDALCFVNVKSLDFKVFLGNQSKNVLAGCPIFVSSRDRDKDNSPRTINDGDYNNGFTFGNNDLSQRVAVNGVSGAITEIRIWVDTARKVTIRGERNYACFPREVDVRASREKKNSTDPDDYEIALGRFYLGTYLSSISGFKYNVKTLAPVRASTAANRVMAAVLDVKKQDGIQSIFFDFGPCSSFAQVSLQIAEIEAFTEPTPGVMPLIPLQPTQTANRAPSGFNIQFSGLDWTTFYGQQLCSEFPNIDFEGSLGYDPTREYSDTQKAAALYYVSGHPYWFHPRLLEGVEMPFVVGYDGLDTNINTERYGAYTFTHLACFQNPGLLRAWQELMPLIKANHQRQVIIADHHYPFGGPVYQPAGYSQIEKDSFRKYLAEMDSGIQVYDESGKITKWNFWDYFNSYNGFRWSAADAGLKDWNDYSPQRWGWNESGTAARQVYLFNALLRYETLKFDSALGQITQQDGAKLFPLYVGETPWHGVDRLTALRTVGIHKWGHEQFSQPGNTYEDFQDHTVEIPYAYWGNLYRTNPFSKNELSLVIETSHYASGEYPYYSPAFTFSTVLDLLLAGNIKSMDIDSWNFVATPESDSYILRNAMAHNVIGAASFKADVNGDFKPLPRSILVIGQRGIDRKDYPFTPDGLRGTEATGLSFGGNELGAVPWLLNRLGYEFDFCDVTLTGVHLDKYSIIFYDSRDLPDGIFEKLYSWADQKAIGKRALITYGALPTRRINNLNWTVGATGIKVGGLKIVDPQAGRKIGIENIQENSFAGGRITQNEKQDFLDFSQAAVPPAKFNKDTPFYLAHGVTPLLKAGDRPILSSRKYASGNMLFYFNYDFGRPSNFVLDASFIKIILSAYGIESVWAKLPENNISVHCYEAGKYPGRLIILKDRAGIEKEIRDNMKDGMKFRLGPQSGKNVQVELKRWISGGLTVYSFNQDKFFKIAANAPTIKLTLEQQMADTFIIVPEDKINLGWVDKFVTVRKQLSAYLGQGIDDLMIKNWGH